MTAAPHRLPASHLKTRLEGELGPLMGARPTAPPWPTGIPLLDGALGGGIPRGRLTELTGSRGVGKTALLRRVVAHVLQQGGWVAWIDATRSLTPAPWAELGARFVVIRLPDPRRSAWTADLLLRSGVFGLVVLDGAPPLSRVQGVRLAQIARERSAACVVLAHHTSPSLPGRRLPGSLRVELANAGSDGSRSTAHSSARNNRRNTPLRITIEKGGVIGRAPTLEVPRVIIMARRLCPDPAIPDRRGVANGTRRPWTARSNTTDNRGEHAIDAHTPVPIEHPVTWGGLGVSTTDLYGTALPGHPARLAAEHAARHAAQHAGRIPLPFPEDPDDRGDRLPITRHRRRATPALG